MSLEHFKKQVLLLHSEQSTLDNLSSGFNDRYTVHCATSGSEALNTLGETQIDVIVTAQDLPGMSGLDALREAKKRSPDTIGILLAGSEDDGLEALVGDQEVFQIVRGTITPASLKTLIDNATRQARLIALAESANDTTANPDEPVAEHIVMETSENGSAIISDGTGRMPVLDPKKISAAADVGSRSVDVLVLTQDDEFLTTVQESARGLHNVIYANTLAQADDAVSKHKVGVAVVDAAMVGMNVEKVTMHLRSSAPRLVAIVAGRRDDGEMLMDLINRGKVYRFLLKPVSPGRSRLAIESSVKHHLEAPDSAFKVATGSATMAIAEAKPAPKAAPKPAPRPAPKPAPKPTPKLVPKLAPEAKKKDKASPKPAPEAKTPPTPKTAPKATPAIVPNRDEALSPIDDGLSAAFGGDDSSFTETLTGIVQSVGKTFSAKNKSAAEAEPEVATATPAAAGSGGSLLSDPKILGMGAAALVVVAGLGFWMFGGFDDTTVTDAPVEDTSSITAADPVREPETLVGPAPGLDDLIDEAQLAANTGLIFDPPGSNAIELYLSALELAPGDPVAETELRQVIDQALGMAESAMLERRGEDAAAALERVALADPDNLRLPFLNAQLAQMQLRNSLDDARVAIREGRFEDASQALDGARALAASDATEVDVVADELSAALNAQQVDEILLKANARLEAGDLIAPSNDNARFYYELALSIDRDSTGARQGLLVIAGKLVLQARTSIDNGDFDGADALLADARRLDPSSSELAASTAAVTAARDRVAQEEAQRIADERAAIEKAAAERRAAEKAAADKAAAEKAAAEKAAADKLAAEKAAADKAAADKLAAEKAAADKIAAENAAADKAAADKLAAEKAAADKIAADKAAADKAAADRLAVDQAPVERAAADKIAADKAAADKAAADRLAAQKAAADKAASDRAAAAQAAAEQATADAATEQPVTRESFSPKIPTINAAPVAASTLKRTKYVAPKYPRAAQRRDLSGWVDVVFIVDIDGTVSEITIRDSNPGETFVSAATKAVEGWEFEPVIENGVAIKKRAAVRMMFALE